MRISSSSRREENRVESIEQTHLSDEPEDVDLLGLSDSMSSVHSLKIGLRVPARPQKRTKRVSFDVERLVCEETREL